MEEIKKVEVPETTAEKKVDHGIRVKNTAPFKLKDTQNRQYMVIPFKEVFKFIPETIIVEKVRGSNNTIFVRAVMTDAEIKKEDAEIKKQEEFIKKQKLEVTKQHDKKENKSSTT